MKTKARKWQLAIVLGAFWTLLGLVFAFVSYISALGQNSSVNLWSIFSLNLFKFYLWVALSPLIFQVTRRFSFERRETLPVNFLTHIPFCIAFSCVHSIIYTLVVWAFEGANNGISRSLAGLFQEYVFFGNFILGILLYALIVITIQAYLLYGRYEEEEARSAKLQAELADARLQALKMQLQPHFLFNTLHSISSLNLIDPQRANTMISRLGEFLRMTLDRSDDEIISLEEELEFLRCYLEIEQIRFSDRLKIEFLIEKEARGALVPHLILQPVIENAIKHGIAPHSAKGLIAIKAEKIEDRLRLEIKDSGANKDETDNKNVKAGGKGLRIVRSRLEHLYGAKNYRFELVKNKDGASVLMEIPFSVENCEIVLT